MGSKFDILSFIHEEMQLTFPNFEIRRISQIKSNKASKWSGKIAYVDVPILNFAIMSSVTYAQL
jgi:hypothetical protein